MTGLRLCSFEIQRARASQGEAPGREARLPFHCHDGPYAKACSWHALGGMNFDSYLTLPLRAARARISVISSGLIGLTM